MAYKVNYVELARIFNDRGEKEAIRYLREECKVSCVYKPIKTLKNKYHYDEEMKKLIIPEDLPDMPAPFLSMEELCDTSADISEGIKDSSDVLQTSSTGQSSMLNDLLNVMLMEKLQEYSGYITIDHIQRVCHINKSRLMAAGFSVHVF